MKPFIVISKKFILCIYLALSNISISAQEAGKSPWGPTDEIGQLNLMTDQSRYSILQRIKSGKTFDLSVDYYKGMPGFTETGAPEYHYWLTRTPQGTVVEDPANVGKEQNLHSSYSADAILMPTHTGTHIDALSHFGLNGKIYNGFSSDEYLGDAGWKKGGAEAIPPIIARGILIDIPFSKGITSLKDGYAISDKDIMNAIEIQKISIKKGDVVLIRTGKMREFSQSGKYNNNPPGLLFSAAKYLAEKEVMIIGGDNLALEAFPSGIPTNWIPVHTYLLAEKGIPIMEVVNLEELSSSKVYEFAFIGASLKIKGGTAGFMRPIAIPIN